MHLQALRRRLPATLLASSLVIAPLPAAAEGPVANLAYGAGSALASLVYGPAKILYALGGGVVAGFAYLFSGGDGAVAEPIIDAAMRGDYVISPEQLTGDRDIHFIGRRREYVDAANVAAGPPEEGY